MSDDLSRSSKLWALGAAIPFLLSIAVLGIALSRQILIAFAVGWPIIQAIGYSGALKRSGGQVDHPLFKTQVMLHWMVLALLIAIVSRVL